MGSHTMNRLLLLLALASPLCAQKSILGTLSEFHSHPVEFGLKPDSGAVVFFQVSPETQVVRIPAGEQNLAKAAPAAITDLAIGDRLLVTFVGGMAEARRIVRITPADIERRNEAERLDWQQRGISGVVSGKTPEAVALELRSPQGVQTVQVMIGSKTAIRRYAPDSVKFSDARPSTLDQIAVGDQLRTRGNKSEDGSRIAAEDIVFGTFLTIVGPITAVNRDNGEVEIRDLTTKAPLTIHVTADSRLKKMPDLHEMFVQMMKAPAKEQTAPPASMAQMLERLPACNIEELKVGTTLVVTATRGARADSVTAILLVTNIDGLIQMAQAQAGDKGLSPVEAIARMHHGMMDGPGGFSLPALIQ
jgi:hypothetical protein